MRTNDRNAFVWVAVLAAAVTTLASCTLPPMPAAQPAEPVAPAAPADQPAVPAAPAATDVPAAPAAAGPVTLTWAMWGDSEELKAHQAVADAFMAQHPDIKVELVAAPWDDYNTKLRTLIASGDKNLYDVFFYGFNVEELVRQGVIEDLAPYADKSGYDLSDYWPGILDRATVDGKPYGLVRDADASVLYYNMDIFDEAGVPYPTADWTWDDLRAAAEKLTKVEANGRVSRYALGMEAGKADAWLRANGGGYVDDFANPTRCILDTPESMEALNFFHDMIANNYIMKPADLATGGGDSAAFQQGKVAMILQNASRIPAFNAAGMNYDIAPIPLTPNGQRVAEAAGASWHMSAMSQHKDEAWEFLQFLQSAEGGQKIYAQSGGMFPALRSMVASPEFQETDQKPATRATFNTVGETLKLINPITWRYWDELSGTITGPGLEKVWALEQTPAEAVPGICEKVNAYLASKAG
jgi:multiple sugar transport system substrate-binding protein